MKSDEKQFEENNDEKKKLESVHRAIQEIYGMKEQKSEAVCEKKIKREGDTNGKETLAAFERLKSFYLAEVKRIYSTEARVDSSLSGKNYTLTRRSLNRHNEEDIKKQITFYLKSDKCKDSENISYSIIFSEHSENIWLMQRGRELRQEQACIAQEEWLRRIQEERKYFDKMREDRNKKARELVIIVLRHIMMKKNLTK